MQWSMTEEMKYVPKLIVNSMQSSNNPKKKIHFISNSANMTLMFAPIMSELIKLI